MHLPKINFRKAQPALKGLKNKYLISSLVFIVWVGFLDKNNFLSQWDLMGDLRALRKELNYYKKEIVKDKDLIQRLQNDPASLEKYARENYLMKKEKEDVFLIVDPSVLAGNHK